MWTERDLHKQNAWIMKKLHEAHNDFIDYLKNKKSTKKEIQAVKAAWNKYRKLGKVRAISLSVLRAKI